MLLYVLLVQTAPLDLTPPNAMARHMFAQGFDPLAGTGLTSLNKHLLPPGDVQVRYWGGFAWGTQNLVLSRRAQKWTAKRLVEGIDKPLTLLPAPKLGWPAFWARAETLGIFILPDQEQTGSKKGFIRVKDGYSNLVEFQKDGTYRAYAYNNPGWQRFWAPGKKMAALDRFIQSQFPTWRQEAAR